LQSKRRVDKIVKDSVEALFGALADALSNGKRIEVRGFGCFSLKYRAPGKVRNPRHGVTIESGARHNIYFRPSKALACRVNGVNELVVSSLPEVVKKTRIKQRKPND
jgi:integration host factor subunit beta